MSKTERESQETAVEQLEHVQRLGIGLRDRLREKIKTAESKVRDAILADDQSALNFAWDRLDSFTIRLSQTESKIALVGRFIAEARGAN